MDDFLISQKGLIQKKIDRYQNPETTACLGDEEAEKILPLHSLAIVRLTLALQRIKNGLYESCTRCHKPIERNRLRAVPEADTCIACSRS